MIGPLKFVEAPDRAHLPPSPEAFVEVLGEPTAMLIPGRDRSRCRAVVTLLHGNEPSGLAALAKWLAERRTPVCDALLIFASTHAALYEGHFEHRMVPGERDLNRCFREPFGDDRPGRLARAILECLDRHGPECVVDIHNTSGRSPSFGVVTHENAQHERLVSLFTERLIVTDLTLGSLMETTRDDRPVVTIECGGALDADAVPVAAAGLERLLEREVPRAVEGTGEPLEVYHHPVRVEFAGDCQFTYSDRPIHEMDVTIPNDIERLNFGSVKPGQPVLWLGSKGLAALSVRDAAGRDVAERYFREQDARLICAAQMKLFMITTNPAIARSDCLCYASLESEHTRLALDSLPVRRPG